MNHRAKEVDVTADYFHRASPNLQLNGRPIHIYKKRASATSTESFLLHPQAGFTESMKIVESSSIQHLSTSACICSFMEKISICCRMENYCLPNLVCRQRQNETKSVRKEEDRRNVMWSTPTPLLLLLFEPSCIEMTLIIISLFIQQGYSRIIVNSYLRTLNIQNKTQSYYFIPPPS